MEKKSTIRPGRGGHADPPLDVTSRRASVGERPVRVADRSRLGRQILKHSPPQIAVTCRSRWRRRFVLSHKIRIPIAVCCFMWPTFVAGPVHSQISQPSTVAQTQQSAIFPQQRNFANLRSASNRCGRVTTPSRRRVAVFGLRPPRRLLEGPARSPTGRARLGREPSRCSRSVRRGAPRSAPQNDRACGRGFLLPVRHPMSLSRFRNL